MIIKINTYDDIIIILYITGTNVLTYLSVNESTGYTYCVLCLIDA